MKSKQPKLSLDKLMLNKETILNLSKKQMGSIVGGVTDPTLHGCHSVDTNCGSFGTDCFSQCGTCPVTYTPCSIDCTGTGGYTYSCTC